MLYVLGLKLSLLFPALQAIHYVSVRAMLGLLTTFLMSVALGRRCIELSGRLFQNTARPFTPENHQKKGSTPTMGGLFMIGAILINIALWCDLSSYDVWILVLSLVSFGMIGFLDDFYKVCYKKGISARLKLLLQIGCSLAVVLGWFFLKNPTAVIYVPIFKGLIIPVGYALVLWGMLVVIATSNAVNLTDGLDGLAIGNLLINFAFFAGTLYVASHMDFATYLHLPYVACSEAVIVGAIVIGASLGFFWFNAYPAEIFMGDVGSLSFGATLAMLALLARQELLLLITGGIFVAEALSVILQIGSIKIFNRRILKMAPLHHHFEMIGWPETKVTTRFHIVTLILSLCAAIMLKIR